LSACSSGFSDLVNQEFGEGDAALAMVGVFAAILTYLARRGCPELP